MVTGNQNVWWPTTAPNYLLSGIRGGTSKISASKESGYAVNHYGREAHHGIAVGDDEDLAAWIILDPDFPTNYKG